MFQQEKITIAVEACMDNWHTSSNNDTKSMYTGNNGDANIRFKVNDEILDISKWQNVTYEEMLPSENPVASGWSGVGVVELGDMQAVNGLNTLSITRLASYNLIIRNIYIIYDVPANAHR